MFNWDDLLIIGDSFASKRNLPTDWPLALSLKLTKNSKEPRGKGFSGCSWWSIRKCLISEIKIQIPKILIICHTHPDRIPSDYDIHFTNSVLDDNFIKNRNKDNDNRIGRNLDNDYEAAREYYKYLYSVEFHSWSENKWYQELENLCQQYQIPIVIHLRCFSDNFYVFNYGITSKQYLKELTIRGEISRKGRNHFTEEQNIKIADGLHNAIINYSSNDRLKDLNLLKEG